MARKKKSEKVVEQSIKLTGKDLLKEAEKYDQLETVTIKDGRVTDIYYNLSNAKINEMLDSYFNFMSQLQLIKQESKEKLVIGDFLDILNMHIIIHFTTISFDIPKSVEAKIDFFEKLLKLDVLEEVFEMFNKDDIAKIYNRFYKRMETYQELIKNSDNYRKLLKQKVKELELENRDIINQVFFNGELDEDGVEDGRKNI